MKKIKQFVKIFLLIILNVLIISGCKRIDNIDSTFKAVSPSDNQNQVQEETITMAENTINLHPPKNFIREITLQEINKFVPINYKLIHDEEFLQNNKIKIEEMKFQNTIIYFLPIEPKELISTCKLLILKYNQQKDNYYIAEQKEDMGDASLTFEKFDFNNDGANELIIKNSYNAGGSGTTNSFNIFKITDKSIESIFNISGILFDFDRQNKVIWQVDYIWGKDESHFGCHFVTILKHELNNNNKFKTTKIISKHKYDWGDNLLSDNCFTFDKITDILRKEKIYKF